MKTTTKNTETCFLRSTRSIKYQLDVIATREGISTQEAMLMLFKVYKEHMQPQISQIIQSDCPYVTSNYDSKPFSFKDTLGIANDYHGCDDDDIFTVDVLWGGREFKK